MSILSQHTLCHNHQLHFSFNHPCTFFLQESVSMPFYIFVIPFIVLKCFIFGSDPVLLYRTACCMQPLWEHKVQPLNSSRLNPTSLFHRNFCFFLSRVSLLGFPSCLLFCIAWFSICVFGGFFFGSMFKIALSNCWLVCLVTAVDGQQGSLKKENEYINFFRLGRVTFGMTHNVLTMNSDSVCSVAAEVVIEMAKNSSSHT